MCGLSCALGYFFTRGKEIDSIENQIYRMLNRTPVYMNRPADYKELSKKYDWVIVATGSDAVARELGVWQDKGLIHIIGGVDAIISGIFAARSIVQGLDYESHMKSLAARIESLSAYRDIVGKFNNDDFDRLLGAIGKPGIKQLLYNTNEEEDFTLAMLGYYRHRVKFFREHPMHYKMLMQAINNTPKEIKPEVDKRLNEVNSLTEGILLKHFEKLPLKQGVKRETALSLITMVFSIIESRHVPLLYDSSSFLQEQYNTVENECGEIIRLVLYGIAYEGTAR